MARPTVAACVHGSRPTRIRGQYALRHHVRMRKIVTATGTGIPRAPRQKREERSGKQRNNTTSLNTRSLNGNTSSGKTTFLLFELSIETLHENLQNGSEMTIPDSIRHLQMISRVLSRIQKRLPPLVRPSLVPQQVQMEFRLEPVFNSLGRLKPASQHASQTPLHPD